jgi:RNA polymerase sigma factor (sigma-70 family)
MSPEVSIENGGFFDALPEVIIRPTPRPEVVNTAAAMLIQRDHPVISTESASELPAVDFDSVSASNQPADLAFEKLDRPSYASRVQAIDSFISRYQNSQTVQKAVLEYQNKAHSQFNIYDLNSLTQYVRQASRYPLLTKEDEVRLFGTLDSAVEIISTIKEGKVPKKFEPELIEATISYNKIYISNLKLVIHIATVMSHKQNSARSEQKDYIQEGNIALGEAIKKFNVSMGYRFSTYATWWIKQRIQRAYAKIGRDFNIPTNVQNEFNNVLATRNEFYEEHHRYPSVKEIAVMLGKPKLYIEDLMISCTRAVSSLDEPVEDGSGRELAEVIESPSGVEPFIGHLISRDLVETAIQRANLSRDELLVLSLRYHIFFPALADDSSPKKNKEAKKYMKIFASTDPDKTIGIKALSSLLGLPETLVKGLEVSALNKLRPLVR